QPVDSYHRKVQAVTHDSSTLGGNSGSAVLVLPRSAAEPMQAVGLHFAGEDLVANYAVPPFDLAPGSRILDAGGHFVCHARPRAAVSGQSWRGPHSGERPRPAAPPRRGADEPPGGVGVVQQRPAVAVAGATTTWVIPVEVSITVGQPTVRPVPPAAVGEVTPA